MKRAIFLLGLCAALLLPTGAFADVPGVSREARQRMYEERRRAEADAKIARVMVQEAVGGKVKAQLVSRLGDQDPEESADGGLLRLHRGEGPEIVGALQ